MIQHMDPRCTIDVCVCGAVERASKQWPPATIETKDDRDDGPSLLGEDG